MKKKISFIINPVIVLMLIAYLHSCNGHAEEDSINASLETVPVTRTMKPEEARIHDIIIGIEKREMAIAGDSLANIDIQGMELVRCSRKTYLGEELKSQQEDFDRYIYYLDHRAKNNKSLNDPLKRRDSQARHDAVVAYLKKEIKNAADSTELYKAVYYIGVQTAKTKYNQKKIIYLDKDMHKVVADYRFLKPLY